MVKRRTRTTLKILTQLHDEPDSEHYGLDLMRATGIKSGTLYPVLRRLEGDGWLEARWEEGADDSGRPRRRMYRVTEEGRKGIAELLDESSL